MGREEILVWQNHPPGHLYIIGLCRFPPCDLEQAACHPRHLSHVPESTLSPKALIVTLTS